MSIHEEPSSGFDYASLPPGVAQALRSHAADIRTRVRNQMTEIIAIGIAVDRVPERLEMARRLGADHVMAFSKNDPVRAIRDLTDDRGVDVAIEALGTQATFEACLRVLRPGGTLSSLGVYSTDLRISLDAFAAGFGDHRIITTLCPGGKERMRRLMETIAHGRVDLKPLVTHRFRLDHIEEAYDLFGRQRDGVMKVAITP